MSTWLIILAIILCIDALASFISLFSRDLFIIQILHILRVIVCTGAAVFIFKYTNQIALFITTLR